LQHDVYFLKLDVEGCEGRVFAGARCLLRAHNVRFIFFEFSAKNMQMVGVALENTEAVGVKTLMLQC